MKKILFFSTYYSPYLSGLVTYPEKILAHLSKKNKVTILTFRYKKSLPKKKKINKNLKIIRIPYWFRLSKGFISPQSIKYFINEAKKAEIIILNQPNFEGVFLGIIGKILNKKVISIFHCEVFFSKGLLDKLIALMLKLSVFVQFNFSDKIIAYTKDYWQSLPFNQYFSEKTSFVLPPIKVTKKDSLFFRQLEKKKKKNIWIGFCGRIAREKGIEHLIKAISLLKKEDIALIFAGPMGKKVSGENKYFQKIKKLLRKNKINYCFEGVLLKGRLTAFYQAVDVLVLPSVNQTEAFGMVQVEAMLSSTPVVASNLPGVRIPIKLTGMGIIIPPENSQRLAIAIKKILDNKKKYVNKKLTNKAKEIFDIKKVYRFYKKTMSKFKI